MSLVLYNTLTRQKELFIPIRQTEVGLYTCGPTVYAPPHIGNLRTYIFEDILRRTLEFLGYNVKHVMNITDVGHLTSDADEGEDKMEKGARASGKSVWDIADEYTKMFKDDLRILNIQEPHIWCKATDHIPEQIALIQILENKGFTYRTTDGIYFDTSKISDYGKLAKLDVAGLKEGARVQANPEKKNITDFALWKFSPNPPAGGSARQMEWPSPWGVGFPGWHIECSAMSMKYLGETFDIHCGGIDHISVHHPNEIAQSEAATGKKFVNYWLHSGFLVIGDNRMGKSEGNSLTPQSVVDKGYSSLAYRYLCLTSHYRMPLNLSWDALEGAQNALTKLYDRVAMMSGNPGIGCAEFEQRFSDAISDDLNMPQALAIMWELIKSNYPDAAKKQSLFKFDRVFGLGLKDIQPLVIPPEVQALVERREIARGTKDWTLSDELRAEIKTHNFIVNDTDAGAIIKRLR